MSLRIVTDSTSDLPPDLAKELSITVVPLNVNFGEETFRDGIDLSPEQFFSRLQSSEVTPKTSQPSIGDFSKVYSELTKQGHEIVSIHASGKLSGTLNSATQALQEVPGAKVELIDSSGVSIWLASVVLAAARAAQNGAPVNEVCKVAQESILQMNVYVVLDTLEYLQRGGRIGKAQAVLGSLLSLKPILTLKDGEVHPHEKVRTRAKARARIREIVHEGAPYAEILVAHAQNLVEAEELASDLQVASPSSAVILAQMGPVIATHAGPGALAVATRKS